MLVPMLSRKGFIFSADPDAYLAVSGQADCMSGLDEPVTVLSAVVNVS